MKVTEKLKKEKSPLIKPHTALTHKKPDSKKPSAKKDDLAIPKSTTLPTQHSASASRTIKPARASPRALSPPNSLIPQQPAARTLPKLVWAKQKVPLLGIIN